MFENYSSLYAAVWRDVPFEDRQGLLSGVHEVQATLSSELFKSDPASRIARLCLADITETLLIKALQVLLEDEGFRRQKGQMNKTAFLKTHLRFTLIEWLGNKADTWEELGELTCVRLPGSAHPK